MREFSKIDLAAAHRPLAHAQEQFTAFNAQHREVEDEISNLQKDSAEGQRPSRLDEDAQRLVDGKKAAPFDFEALTSRRDALVRRRATLTKAVALVRRRVNGEETAASRIVCEKLAPEHRAIVGAVAKSLIQLGRALEVERAFRENLNDSGVKFSGYLRPMPVPGLGLVTDNSGRLAAWFKDAIEHELIDVGDIPADWREKWSAESWRRPAAA